MVVFLSLVTMTWAKSNLAWKPEFIIEHQHIIYICITIIPIQMTQFGLFFRRNDGIEEPNVCKKHQFHINIYIEFEKSCIWRYIIMLRVFYTCEIKMFVIIAKNETKWNKKCKINMEKYFCGVQIWWILFESYRFIRFQNSPHGACVPLGFDN